MGNPRCQHNFLSTYMRSMRGGERRDPTEDRSGDNISVRLNLVREEQQRVRTEATGDVAQAKHTLTILHEGAIIDIRAMAAALREGSQGPARRMREDYYPGWQAEDLERLATAWEELNDAFAAEADADRQRAETK